MKTRRPHVAVEVSESGLALRASPDRTSGPSEPWPWSCVEEVRAFKRDLVAADLICLQITLSGGVSVEVDEEMEGFEALVAAMPSQLRGCPPFEEWWYPVAVPAFSLNERVLYVHRRGGAA